MPEVCGSAPDPSDVTTLRTMVLSREFDRRAALVYRQGGAWFGISSAGHEALAVLAPLLRDDDVIAPHYRDRALLLARGTPLSAMVHDVLATDGGDARGRNMTSHFSDRSRNVFSVASPVASNCLPATGFAWAAQLRGEDSVVLCLTGDASTRQGEFFEAVAFAVEKALPVVFLVEDNEYGISTRTTNTNPGRLGLLGKELLVTVAGHDTRELNRAARHAVSLAREGGGPTVLWCRMDRLDSHTSADDQRLYRKEDELTRMQDPIELLAQRLRVEGKLGAGELELIRSEAASDVEKTFRAVAAGPRPDPATVLDHLVAPDRPVRSASVFPGAETMLDAVITALGEALSDPRCLVFGEDVEDPKGGVFGLTKGLSATGRVFNSPLAEATIVGVGIGLAAAGLRPVVELQFVDFAAPAWNQITAQLATLRWRTSGGWHCPLLVYAPWGAYLPGGGIWHSQSNESLFTHVPGLRVAVPATAQDAWSVFDRAGRGADPVIVLLPKHLLRRRDLPYESTREPVVRNGGDVTVVAWGNCLELAVQTAESLSSEGIGSDVIGLCWLDQGCPEAVHESVRRTGRLVVVQEDVATSSFGASLIAEALTDETTFYRLLAPPALVSRLHVHVPYDTGLEAAVLPSVRTLGASIRSVVGREATCTD